MRRHKSPKKPAKGFETPRWSVRVDLFDAESNEPRDAETSGAQAETLVERTSTMSNLSRVTGDAGRGGVMSAFMVPNVRCVLVRDAGTEGTTPPRAASADDAAEIFFERMANLPCEEVHVLYLDGQNRVTGAEMIARGGLHGCALSTRDALRGAIVANASALIIAHNHPSGDPTPSSEDIGMTRALQAAAKTVGLPLLDHLVVCPESKKYRSVLEVMGS
jgi:DNA repair protein RadC